MQRAALYGSACLSHATCGHDDVPESSPTSVHILASSSSMSCTVRAILTCLRPRLILFPFLRQSDGRAGRDCVNVVNVYGHTTDLLSAICRCKTKQSPTCADNASKGFPAIHLPSASVIAEAGANDARTIVTIGGPPLCWSGSMSVNATFFPSFSASASLSHQSD